MLLTNPNKATFSPCLKYRYTLTRNFVFGKRDQVCFIGLNPSTADKMKNDPTIRRGIGYAMGWGFNRLVKLNLFAFRATDPNQLYLQIDPVGVQNNKYIKEVVAASELIVLAWGTKGGYLDRDKQVLELLKNQDLHYLALTKDGYPQHLLYLKKTLKPKRWERR